MVVGSGVRVVNRRREPCTVYGGRPSPWGNPYVVGRDGTREEVVERYRAWIRERPELLDALEEALEGCEVRTLGCWCAPLPCHAYVLAEMLETRRILS